MMNVRLNAPQEEPKFKAGDIVRRRGDSQKLVILNAAAMTLESGVWIPYFIAVPATSKGTPDHRALNGRLIVFRHRYNQNILEPCAR